LYAGSDPARYLPVDRSEFLHAEAVDPLTDHGVRNLDHLL
jgi:hypothetical protein